MWRSRFLLKWFVNTTKFFFRANSSTPWAPRLFVQDPNNESVWIYKYLNKEAWKPNVDVCEYDENGVIGTVVQSQNLQNNA